MVEIVRNDGRSKTDGVVVVRRNRNYIGIWAHDDLTRQGSCEAADLGYTDQAHLARDFKSAVGRIPRDFASSVR